jgi:ABC-type molybdate transport system ATPase subunit
MNNQTYIKIKKQWKELHLDVDLCVTDTKHIMLILGGNGEGKTTLLRCVLGEIPPDEGRIFVQGSKVYHSEEQFHLPIPQRQIGYVPQQDILFEGFDVLENISMGLWKTSGMSKSQAREEGRQMLEELGFSMLANRFPQHCSGGQKRIISIIRALLMKPKLLLLDEPLHSVDLPTKLRLVKYIFDYVETYKIPCLWVTHDGVVLKYHREAEICYLEKGKGASLHTWKGESSMLQTLQKNLLN